MSAFGSAGGRGWFVFLVLLAAGLAGGAEWKSIPGGRFAELRFDRGTKAGFSLMDGAASGIRFTNAVSQERHLTNQIYLNGSGVAAGDVDGDGFVDVYFCGLDGDNKLFRNLGNWRFEDVTAAAGVACANLDCTGAAFADIDGDSDLDLVVNSIAGGTHLFLNDGKGHFKESANSPLNAGRGGMSLALGDLDGDGALDLYVANYRTVTLRDQPNTRFSIKITNGVPMVDAVEGRPLTSPALTNRFSFDITMGERGVGLNPDENGEADGVYRNDGKGRFVPMSFTDGSFLDEDGKPLAKPPFDWGLSVMIRDLNGDGLPDIYVCNDFKSPDRIWMNLGASAPREKAARGEKERAGTGAPLTPALSPLRGEGEARDGVLSVEQGFDSGTDWFEDAVFPLTPALSRGERENGSQVLARVKTTVPMKLEEEGRRSGAPLTMSQTFDSRPLDSRTLRSPSPRPSPLGRGSPAGRFRVSMRKSLVGGILTPALSPLRGEGEASRVRFQAADRLAFRQLCLSAMGVDVADVDRDGLDDIFVVDMLSRDHVRRLSQRIDIKPEILAPGQIENRPQYGRNMLFHNRGDGTYAEIAQMLGLQATEWSWTPIFLDVDLDGYEDLLVSNGFERDGMNVDVLRKLEQLKQEKKRSNVEQLRLRTLFPRLDTPNLAFRNRGHLEFEEQSAQWGFEMKGVSQGMALADLDNDGDLDVIINNFNRPAAVFRNNAPGPRVAVRLRGKAPNTHGIGAKIKVVGGPVAQSQEIVCGGRYLSSDDAMRTFAAGEGEMRIEVTWRSGKRSVIGGVKGNRVYEVEEAVDGAAVTAALEARPRSGERTTPHPGPLPRGEGEHLASSFESNGLLSPAFSSKGREEPGGGTRPTGAAAIFRDVSQLIGLTHVDESFDDFAVQPLLPNRLSQPGPGISWFDCDNDGWEELIIGSGRGGQLAVFRNNKGNFARLSTAPFNQAVTRDQTTVLGWRDGEGRAVLLAGSANYEDGLAAGAMVRGYDLSKQAVVDMVAATASSAGPMALADVDGDGRLDLFVGGRVIPGKYPQAASSMLLRGGDSGFAIDAGNSRTFAEVGLVSGAVFSDVDGDGDPDLVLACEWGAIRVFRNEGGKFVDATDRLGLAKFPGWWNGVAAGDFDGDGRMDIVASNWGRNTKYEMFRRSSSTTGVRAKALHAYYGDVDENGAMDFIEAYEDAKSNTLMPLQPLYLVGAAMPFLQEKFPTFDAYARSTLDEIYGDKLKRAKKLEVTWVDSTVFLNRGDHFEAHPLPMEAQVAPAFAVCVADFDGDGNEDVFLSQNFFATQPETSRYDGGRGLCLLGNGKGGFKSLAGQESGIKIYGEQRGAAVCDYDHDGRVDLAVGQNSAPVKLYHNETARPGLRVRLVGAAGNPDGVGAMIRFTDGKRFGAAREIHAGSGYWSQDSAVQVLAMAEWANQISVRWPGGKTTASAVPKEAREVTIGSDGTLKVVR